MNNRKRLKKKRRSCAMCKPHKMGWELRFKAKDFSLRKAHVEEILDAQRTSR